MDLIERMNRAMEYIEECAGKNPDPEILAGITLCSGDHFRRMFSSLAGITLTEYIRRRRMTLAALEMLKKDRRVLDVALEYGYGSADSFARAFQSVHGISPSEVREGGELTSWPRMRFSLTVKGAEEMNVRLMEKEEFRIVGIRKRVNLIFQGVNPEIQEMAEQLTPEIIGYLKSLSDREPAGIIIASADFSEGRMEEKARLDHYIGVATGRTDTEGDFAVLPVPAGTWAVFRTVGPFPETLQDAWGRIYSEWFPASGYESTGGPEILWNEGPDTGNPEHVSEIWIQVQKSVCNG